MPEPTPRGSDAEAQEEQTEEVTDRETAQHLRLMLISDYVAESAKARDDRDGVLLAALTDNINLMDKRLLAMS